MTQLPSHDLLPPHAIPLASPLSVDEREVLSYLLLLGLHFLPPSCDKTLWKPWKHGVSSSASSHKSFPRRIHSSTSFTGVACENCSSSYDAQSVICDCFSCYSRFWRRWNASPNRDIINAILDIVELQDTANGENRYRQQKNFVLEARGKKGKKRSEKKKQDANILQPSVVAKNEQESSTEARGLDAVHNSPLSSAQSRPTLTIPKHTVSRRKAKGVKNRTSLKGSDILPLDFPSLPEVESTKEVERNGSIRSSAVAGCASLQAKNGARHQRAGKRKNNQVIPLDCEGPSEEMGEEQELGAPTDDGNVESSMSMRVTDSNLRGRGFFAHVFIGSLGGVASRLWDLVSLGFGSRGIDYY